jgi:NOL1/NOP2/sun family putative RNA methylase
MQLLLSQEFPLFLASYAQPPITGLRVNTLKISPPAFLEISPYSLSPLPWCPAGFELLPSSAAPGKHPYHAAGLYYLQDPSAMAAAELLAPRPGEMVLDLAGAPGGKTTHIAALMQGEGVLIANEIHTRRAWELAANLERWGAVNAMILNETPARLAQALPAAFDRVLVDAPCSGEGMFRKNEAARLEWSPHFVAGCAVRQSAILEDAARLLKPGGSLVYSTCTFSYEENEAVIERFLDAHSNFELAAVGTPPGASPAFAAEGKTPPGWRFWPHRSAGEGHFLAALQRRPGRAAPAAPQRPNPARRPSRQELTLWETFRDKFLVSAPPADTLALHGAYLYAIPPQAPSMAGLRILHPGLWLGQFKSGRFEPAHALAMALRREQARLAVELDLAQAESYLRGHPVSQPGEEGWALACTQGYPLGWGRQVNDVVKNFYPKGLRWL